MDDRPRDNSQRPRNTRPPRDSRHPEEATSPVALPSHPAGPATYRPVVPFQPTYSSFSPAGEQLSPQREVPTFQITAASQDYTMSRHTGQGPSTATTPRPQQYRLVSPGTPADPRNMTQVSPGFIFVIFPMFASFVCLSCSFPDFPFPPVSTLPLSVRVGVSFLISIFLIISRTLHCKRCMKLTGRYRTTRTS